MSRRTPETETISVRLPSSVVRALEDAAHARRVSRNKYAAQVLGADVALRIARKQRAERVTPWQERQRIDVTGLDEVGPVYVHGVGNQPCKGSEGGCSWPWPHTVPTAD